MRGGNNQDPPGTLNWGYMVPKSGFFGPQGPHKKDWKILPSILGSPHFRKQPGNAY